MDSIKQLLDIMASLRAPETGCPWDIKQTFETIVPYTLEEAYEVADSIERGQMDELKDELGDLMFQVVFYAQMAKEQKLFEFDDVVKSVNEKLVRRHPHVFANADYTDDAALNEAWEKSKSAERDHRSGTEQASILDGVAYALPSLKRAQKLQKRAARAGFDWPDINPVFDKVQEEIVEIKQAMEEKDQLHIKEEMGDLLFVCANLARHLGVDAEEALRFGNKKFEKRFNYIEKELADNNKQMDQCELGELEEIWQQSKKHT
jgi:nucleoside triphosphate diphosphatase